MFSYFGSKSKTINYYSPPIAGYIIEPFCGSARYACKYGLDCDVWINDKYDVIYKIWKWIRGATRKDLLSLPELKRGDDLRDFKQLSDSERLLLGFSVNRGVQQPKNIMTDWAAGNDGEIAGLKNRLIHYVGGGISHWKITNRDWSDVITNRLATYFIDPPYQHRRTDYVVSSRSNLYKKLRKYCKTRRGQVIVCEGDNADWLPFENMKIIMGSRHKQQENVWERLCDDAVNKINSDLKRAERKRNKRLKKMRANTLLIGKSL
jgi:site-specific DNA-adenine methylase